MTAARQRAGYLLALAGFGLLPLGDAVVKSMAGAWPGTAVAALRFTFGALGIGMILAWREGRAGFVPRRWYLQAARGASLALASLLFFLAIFAMPLAEATAIQFANPMMTALISAVLLGERATRVVWIATAIALAGVLIVLRPNLAVLGPAAFLPLAAAFFMGLLLTLNRMTAGDTSAVGAQFFVAFFAALTLFVAAWAGDASGVAAMQIGWPSASVIARCALVAVSASIAHSLIYAATVRASSASIAPAVYVQIIAATIIGIVWFGDWPDGPAVAGTMIVIGAGLWLWYQGRTRSAVAPEK